MKKQLTILIFILIFNGLFCMATEDDTVHISILRNKMKITQYGKPTELTTDNLVYNGTTYVPLRKAAKTFGYEVEWNETTPTQVNLSNEVTDGIKTVSLINLIATPERYHKQRVRVQGYCRLEFEANRLCFTDQTEYILYSDYVPLQLPCDTFEDLSDYYKFDGKLIEIVATFNYFPNTNYNLTYLSNIEEIKLCETYEDVSNEYQRQAKELFGEGAYFDFRTYQFVSPNDEDNELIYGENWRKIIGREKNEGN